MGVVFLLQYGFLLTRIIPQQLITLVELLARVKGRGDGNRDKNEGKDAKEDGEGEVLISPSHLVLVCGEGTKGGTEGANIHCSRQPPHEGPFIANVLVDKGFEKERERVGKRGGNAVLLLTL